MNSSAAPTISVIMSMRNSASTIGAAVQSVRWQTFHNWELVLIDDGSSDQSVDIVRAFDDCRIRLVQEAASAGLATRLNQAVALSRGEFIARMDADDICFPERLSMQIARLRQDKEIDLLGSAAVVFANDAELLGELPIKVTHRELSAQPFRGFPLPHPTWCGRAAWFKAHPYNESLRKTQDQDLLLRTFQNSRFAGLDEVLIGYRQDALDLGKLLLGRRIFAGSLWRHGRARGTILPAVAGVARQVLKGGVDVATTALGVSRRMQKYRLNPVSPKTEQAWLEVQKLLGALN